MKRTITAAAAAAVASLAFTGLSAHAADAAPAHDLSVGYTVSTAKIPGYAGFAAIKVSNEGSDRYYGDFPMVTFDIKVKTVSGPEGVDRLITPYATDGAHIRDMGFNAATSTRTFRVTLANPINKGAKDVRIASLSFGDGDTTEGRIVQKIVTTQVGRLSDDTANSNDQNVDSTATGMTKDDFGKVGTVAGLF